MKVYSCCKTFCFQSNYQREGFSFLIDSEYIATVFVSKRKISVSVRFL